MAPTNFLGIFLLLAIAAVAEENVAAGDFDDTSHTTTAAPAGRDFAVEEYDDDDVFDSRRTTAAPEFPEFPVDETETSLSRVPGHRRWKHYQHRKSDNETANPKGRERPGILNSFSRPCTSRLFISSLC